MCSPKTATNDRDQNFVELERNPKLLVDSRPIGRNCVYALIVIEMEGE